MGITSSHGGDESTAKEALNATTSTPSGNWVFLELVKDRWESDGLSQVF